MARANAIANQMYWFALNGLDVGGAKAVIIERAGLNAAGSDNPTAITMDADKVEEMVRYEVLSEVGVPPDDVLVRHHVRKGVTELITWNQHMNLTAIDQRAFGTSLAIKALSKSGLLFFTG